MAKFRRKNISIFARLRNYFITGIVVLVPIGITLYLTKFFISISSKLIPYNLNPNNYLPFEFPGLDILLSVVIINKHLICLFCFAASRIFIVPTVLVITVFLELLKLSIIRKILNIQKIIGLLLKHDYL